MRTSMRVAVREGFDIPVVEAIAMGKAVVAITTGGLPKSWRRERPACLSLREMSNY